MSNNLSNYCQPAILNALFSKTPVVLGALASAPTLYVALLTSAPTNASTGATVAETTYGSYARKATVAADWNASSGTSPATITNANALAFPQCTSGTPTITHFALIDSATIGAGNMILWGALNSSLAVSNGITPQFASGQLACTLD